MSQPAGERPLIVEDLYGMQDDGLKHELQAGVLVSEPLPGFRHGRIVVNLSALLAEHVRARRLGVVVAETGFILARRPDTVRGPDVAFVTRERIEKLADPTAAFSGPPDLAIEVLSPSNAAASMHAKVADYLAAGTRQVWLVDPARETVTVYRSLLSPAVYRGDDVLDGEDVVPGFRVRVADLFED